MYKTKYNRKLDACGRLVIPAPLRSDLNLQVGQDFDYYIMEDPETHECFLCIKCPTNLKSDIIKAKMLLEQNGYTVN